MFNGNVEALVYEKCENIGDEFYTHGYVDTFGPPKGTIIQPAHSDEPTRKKKRGIRLVLFV